MSTRELLFRQALKRAGTQQALARSLGVSQPYVSQIHSGVKQLGTPSIHKVRRLWPDLEGLAIAALLESPVGTGKEIAPVG